jgi:hypothetical protein
LLTAVATIVSAANGGCSNGIQSCSRVIGSWNDPSENTHNACTSFGAATIGLRLASLLMGFGLSAHVADAIGIGAVVAVITYASLIIGELVPKQIALQRTQRFFLS